MADPKVMAQCLGSEQLTNFRYPLDVTMQTRQELSIKVSLQRWPLTVVAVNNKKFMTHDKKFMTHDKSSWHMTKSSWHMTKFFWQMTKVHDKWQKVHDTWQKVHDT